MGGSVVVGVRRSDGREYWSDRWTNPQPWIFANPDFQKEGTFLEEYLSYETFRNPNGPTMLEGPPEDMEGFYGYILYDFKDKAGISRQEYSEIGRILVQEKGDLREARALQKEGWITRIENYKLTEEVSFSEMVKEIEADSPYFFGVYFEGPIKMQHDDTAPAEDAIAWAKEHGWAMKTTVPVLKKPREYAKAFLSTNS